MVKAILSFVGITSLALSRLVVAQTSSEISKDDKIGLSCDHVANFYVEWAETQFTPDMFITSNQVRCRLDRLVVGSMPIADVSNVSCYINIPGL